MESSLLYDHFLLTNKEYNDIHPPKEPSEKEEESLPVPQDTEKVISLCKEQCFWACDENWLADVLAYFGEKIFNKLIEFIQYMEINDLHNGNIGYINLKPVLMDYSGWND